MKGLIGILIFGLIGCATIAIKNEPAHLNKAFSNSNYNVVSAWEKQINGAAYQHVVRIEPKFSWVKLWRKVINKPITDEDRELKLLIFE